MLITTIPKGSSGVIHSTFSRLSLDYQTTGPNPAYVNTYGLPYGSNFWVLDSGGRPYVFPGNDLSSGGASGHVTITGDPANPTVIVDLNSPAATGTGYYFSIGSVIPPVTSGNYAYMNQYSGLSFIIGPPVPVPQLSGSVLPQGASSFLFWTPISGILWYNIYKNGVLIGTSSGSNFRDTSTSVGQSNSYYVTAVSSGFESQPSNSVNLTSVSLPTLNYTAGCDGTSLVLNWLPVAGATGYQLFRSGVKVYDGTALTFTDTRLPLNTDYTYTLVAYNSADSSAPSAPLTISPCLETPVLTTVLDCEGAQVSLFWDSVPQASFYNLYKDGVLLLSRLVATSYVDTNVVIGQTYIYNITSVEL